MRAQMLTPHNFSQKYSLLSVPEKPIIYIDKTTLEKMYHYINLCDKEIGWLGTVEQDEDDFVIHDVFLLKQDVSGTHTKFDPDVVAEFYQELLKQEGGAELANKILFWGHSHVNMDTNPSGQDDSQMDEFGQNGNDFFIRGIFNKKGKASFSVFYYKKNYAIHDVEWAILNEFDWNQESAIKEEIESKVSHQIGYHYNSHGSNSGEPNYQNGDWCNECTKYHFKGTICPKKDKFCKSCNTWFVSGKGHYCKAQSSWVEDKSNKDNDFGQCDVCHKYHHVNYDCTKGIMRIQKYCRKCDKYHDETKGCDQVKKIQTGSTFCNVCKAWHSDKDHKCSDIIKSLTHRVVRRIQSESIPKTMIGSDQSTEVISEKQEAEKSDSNVNNSNATNEQEDWGIFGV